MKRSKIWSWKCPKLGGGLIFREVSGSQGLISIRNTILEGSSLLIMKSSENIMRVELEGMIVNQELKSSKNKKSDMQVNC